MKKLIIPFMQKNHKLKIIKITKIIAIIQNNDN